MASKAPADSRIPVFCSNPKPLSRFSRPLANLSNKVRAHLSSDSSSKHRQLFGILGGGPSKSSKSKAFLQTSSQSCPSERPVRPTRFFESFDRPKESFSLTEVNSLEPKISKAHLGRRVCVAGHKVGVLRYVGKIELDPGYWCGVEFDDPIGLNDGSARGVRYFVCPPLHGVLVPASKVALVQEEVGEFVSEVSDSGPHSLLAVSKNKRHSMGEDWIKEEAPPPPTVKRVGSVKSVSQASTPTPSSTNSNGVLIWDWTIGSQHSSSAGSLVPSARALSSSVPDHSHVSLQLSKHSSFEFDDSLGILTPDQMNDFTMNCSETNIPRTPSTEDVPFLIQDLDYDKENDNQRRGSKRSSLEMQFEEASVAKNAQSQLFNNLTLSKREGSLEEKKYPNEIVMKEPEDVKERRVAKDELMEQEIAKDISEDTEMSDSNPSKKTSAMSVSYEPGSETVSNSENMEFIRINRTPSLEDLPMDKVDGKIEALAGPSKHVLPPPTSFVTSVTSIASLDNGYQGDGEWSRPASRGADHSPLANKVKTMDPMTDSDFFTESDADMHDDTSGQMGSGTGRGDRKAQVIDGTLYGGVSGSAQNPTGGSVYMSNQGNQRCPAFTPNTEEMDSSGIYSDLERKPEEPNSDGGQILTENNVDETNENEKDFSPEGSTRTGSSIRSDMSQTLISPAAFANLLMEQVNTIRNLAVSVPMESNENIDDAMEDDVFVNPTTDITDVLSEKTVVEVKDPSAKKREDHVIKKYKMPKRNVVSKIKTMITSNSTNKKEVEDENQENRRPGRTQRKNGRWDAVMNKIAQGKEEEKTKPSRLKEVKSKVFAGITVAPAAATQAPVQARSSVLQQASRKLSTRSLTNAQSASTRSLRDVTSLKSKSRRSRTRGSECSLPAGKSPTSQASSRNSSLSDVSLSKTSPQSLRGSKKRDGIRSTSPQSDGSAPGRPHTQTLPPRLLPPRTAVRTLQRIAEGCSKPALFEAEPLKRGVTSVYSLSSHIEKNGGVVAELKSSPIRKSTQRRPITAPSTKPAPLRDVNRVDHVASGVVPGVAAGVATGAKPLGEVVTRAPPAPTVRLDVASKELKHAAHGVEALGVLLNYLVYNLDAFSTPQLKKDLEKMRSDWLNTKLQMEEVKVSYLRSEEEKKSYQRQLEETQAELRAQGDSHTQRVQILTKGHEDTVKELEWRLTNKVEEVRREHQQELCRLRQEHSKEVERVQAVANQRLSERERELSERLTATQSDYDTIKEQSRRLLDSMHSDKDAKLQATAGRCKMLQDEVASLRAVLELRSSELQELRKTSELAQRDALQLPPALQRITVLQARVEDLELQLERKTAVEQALAAEKEMMEQKVQQEDSKNKRLSQYNEELVWKLKHSSEVVSALAALNQEITTAKNIQLLSSPHSNLTTPKHCHGESHQRNGLTGVPKEGSPPQSPKVKGVVEKSDSVSWVLDLDEAPQNVATRLVRRAHSMRAVQSATPSPAHQTRTLPNPHKRQRSRTTTCVPGNKPQRTRSFSFDSDSSEVPVPRKLAAEWDRESSVSPPSQTGSQIDDTEDLIVVETIGEDRLSFLDLDRHIDREKIEVMGGEDFASPKLSSSSGGSEISVRSRRNEPKGIDNEEILMINRVDGLISSLPKESAGEAMISEETSDNDSGTRDSDEEVERYCSDDDSLSGSASELVERRRKYLIEHKIKIDLKHQNLTSKKVTELMPGSDSGSLSAATTAMDLSWSEDIDLLPSESEG
ncbi:uncharacterized protein LOC124356546 isoform X3 [Homalodisca vitripennis]|uniref:uncharacterized protein LOC124356546 isoform X3 n=1 Tax=Homalodisca vitripennis TaxID=197043 RepID=UPI001EEC99CB|nr:uncharacterized protein LOC124356546 isoform X3 [Homalodisca vitripennis]